MKRITMNECIIRLDRVLNDNMSREELSDWAHGQMRVLEQKDGFDWTTHDEKVWECLTTLYGMDLLDTPTGYLHNDRDLKDWMRHFQELSR